MTPTGVYIKYFVATAFFLPEKSAYLVSVPATVVIMPVLATTFLIRWLTVSAMNMLPDGSTATSQGEFKEVLVAAMFSFKSPALPSPATVVIKPVLIVTLRIR